MVLSIRGKRYVKDIKPAEWSEEDEEKMNQCMEYVAKDYNGKLISWLKSLKNRGNFLKSNTNSPWKPSEEQIGTLKQWLQDHELDGDSRYVYPIFYSLLTDLQKL